MTKRHHTFFNQEYMYRFQIVVSVVWKVIPAETSIEVERKNLWLELSDLFTVFTYLSD